MNDKKKRRDYQIASRIVNYYAQTELKHIYSLVKRVAAGKKNESFIITNKVPYVIKERLQRNVIERKKRTVDNSFAFFYIYKENLSMHFFVKCLSSIGKCYYTSTI